VRLTQVPQRQRALTLKIVIKPMFSGGETFSVCGKAFIDSSVSRV